MTTHAIMLASMMTCLAMSSWMGGIVMKSTTKQMGMYMMRSIMLVEAFHQVLGSVQIGVSRVAAKTEDYNQGIVR